jgi:tetratricopeptide (TPR) repeat protein
MLERALGERYGVSIGSVPGAASGISAKEYFSQGIDYFRSGDYQQSMRSFTRAIKLSPNSAGAYNNRGLTYKNMGQYDRAIADFNKALELNPNSVEAYNNRGLTYNNMGQYDQAIKDYRVAARLGDEIAQRFLRSRGIDW